MPITTASTATAEINIIFLFALFFAIVLNTDRNFYFCIFRSDFFVGSFIVSVHRDLNIVNAVAQFREKLRPVYLPARLKSERTVKHLSVTVVDSCDKYAIVGFRIAEAEILGLKIISDIHNRVEIELKPSATSRF